MEVLVSFLGGDVDRPVITGCLYNATHPSPFRLPSDKHRSGIRTQSSDDSGYNELSFQDRAGEEQVLVQAQRDLDFSVGRDHTAEIERHESHSVRGSRTLSVDGAETRTVGQGLTESIGGAHVQRVKRDQTLAVDGDRTDAVTGKVATTIGGDREVTVGGDARHTFGGRAELSLQDDAVVRTDGHLVAIVGQHDARRSATIHVEGRTDLYSTGVTEIVAEKGIVLRVGDSSIRMTDKSIEIGAETVIVRGKKVYAVADETMRLKAKKEALLESEKKVFLQAEAGSVQLTRDARIDGDLVKLNCSPEPVEDEVPEEEELKKTTFSLVDDKGKPMAGQRFVLIMPDGSERSGVLDGDGQAVLELADSGDIVFPDVDKPEPA
jgi:type VI secretion system secreted protein VgrG